MGNPSECDSEESENRFGENTRRQFVSGGVGALSALAVGGTFTGSVHAQDEDEDDDEEDEEDEETEEPEFEDDVAILNYALTLEYLEARFYRDGLDNIGEDALCNCRALGEDSYLGEQVYDELRTIQEHEESHVETLVSTIESLDGEPTEEPEFDFGLAVQYPMAFLHTAAQLEDIGVSAYAGAAPYIENEDLVEPALGIHSVEARHASFLRTVTDQTGFPDEIDEPRSRSEVLELAGEFIVDEEEDETDEDEEEGEGEEGGEEESENEQEGEGDMPDDEDENASDSGNETDNEGGNASDSGNETDDS